MPLEDIFIQEMDRATSRLETVRINPTRHFLSVPLDATGHWTGSPALWIWQNGVWYDTGGNEVTDLDLIPQKFKQEIEDHPVVVTQAKSPAVTFTCPFCHQRMNQSESDQHLVQHVHDTLKAAGTTAVPPPVTDPAERPVSAKNTHKGV